MRAHALELSKPDVPKKPVDPESIRNELGRFKQGHTGNGKGNPINRRLVAMRGQVLRAFDAGQVVRVLRAMAKKAEKGDAIAGRVFLEYTLGKAKGIDEMERAGAARFVFTFNAIPSTPADAAQRSTIEIVAEG